MKWTGWTGMARFAPSSGLNQEVLQLVRAFAFSTAILVITLISLAAAIAAPLRMPFKGLPATELSFNIGGQEPEWKLESSGGASARYSWQGYSLSLAVEKKRVQNVLRFKLDAPKGQTLSVDSYTATITVPQAGLHSVMVPNIGPIGQTLNYYHQHNKWPENVPLYRCLLPEGFEQGARANTDAPFILLSDNKGNNGISAGWATAERATVLKGGAEGANYVLTLKREEDIPFKGEALEDALVISSARRSWFDVEREYAKTFDRFNGRRHLPTVVGWQESRCAISWFVAPSAAASTMRQRSAKAWALFGRRAQRSSVSRSVSERSIATVGRPRVPMAPPSSQVTMKFAKENLLSYELATQDTRYARFP